MTAQRNPKEFIAMVALITALGALAIDSVLPAMGIIADEFQVGSHQRHWLISVLILGMSIGQLIYGPLADAKGRKPSLYVGLTLFLLGCILSVLSQSFEILIISRFLQGLGVASSRVVTGAIIRDSYQGAAMAQIMSFTMSVFILVPIVAPALGQGILLFANWRYIFGFMIFTTLVAATWFALLQEETLAPEKTQALSFRKYFQAARMVFTTRQTIGYTLASGTVFGGFLGYLSSAQSIFEDVFHLGSSFALYFGILAFVFGSAFVLNAKLVMKFPMVMICKTAVWGIAAFSLLFFVSFFMNPDMSVNVFTMLMTPLFFCIALVFGNLNALAMVPMGRIAGSASSLIGSISTFISVPVGAWVGANFDNTLWSLSVGFLFVAPFSVALVYWASLDADEGNS